MPVNLPDGDKRTRMEVSKSLVEDFIAGDGDKLVGRADDLIGLITFARYPDTVCPLILDCWWEVFDVAACLREHLEPDEFKKLAKRGFRPKVTSLLDLIQQAQQNAQAEPPPDAPEDAGHE